MTPRVPAQRILCRLEDIVDPGSKGVTVTSGDTPQEVIVVRQGARVYGYLNNCPHTGGPLDWVPDRFLDLEREYIQCSTHDALFRIEDGVCVAGPCAGDRLTPVQLIVEAGEVILADGESRQDGQSEP